MDYDGSYDYIIRWNDDEDEVYDTTFYNDNVNDIYARAKCRNLGNDTESLNWRNNNGHTALMLSVLKRDIATLKVLLAAGADPNITRSSENTVTALTLAFQKGLTFSIKELVRYGANFTCEKGIEALELAVSKCFFHELIAGEETFFASDNSNRNIIKKTAIVVAFENGRQSLLTKLLNCGLSLKTTLLLDSTLNKPELVKLLIDNRVDVNATTPSLDTAIHKSAQSNNIESIKLLIRAKSNINAVNKDGETALYKAVCFECSEVSLERELRKLESCKNLEIIKLLIEAKADVNAKDQHGDTILHKALKYGKTEAVKLLIDAKADVDAINKTGETVLHHAVVMRDTEIVKQLVRVVSNINAPTTDGDTALHKAVRFCNNEVVELLIDAKADVNVVNKMGNTALHKAVDERNTEIVKLLIDIVSNINVPNSDGNTVLHIAARKDNIDVIKLLVNAKVNVNTRNKNGETPLHVASISATWVPDYYIKYLITPNSKSEHNETLRSAISESCTNVHYLIESGADVNAEDNFGNTPLSIAVANDNLMLAYILIHAKADVNKMFTSRCIPSTSSQQVTSHASGQTLLWMTLSKQCQLTDMAKLLIQHGADVNVPNEDNQTVLMLAVDNLDVKWVELTISAGAEVNAPDNSNNSILIRALKLAIREIEKRKITSDHDISSFTYFRSYTSYFNVGRKDEVENSKTILRLLVEAGCTINTPNSPYPMVFAVNWGEIDHVKLLIEHGGNVDAQDHELNSLLMQALKNKSFGIVEILMASGADVINVKNKFGDMTLHFAAKCKHLNIFRTILENIVGVKGNAKLKHGVKRRKCFDKQMFNLEMLNNRSETPLYIASANGRGKNVRLLLKYGASANIQSQNGNTALMTASKRRFEKVAKILLAAKADVNIRNKRGENALLIAAKSGCTKTVELLILMGADPLSSTNSGNTGLHLAANKDITKLFVNAGADVNTRNIHGQTPLHFAAKQGKDTILSFLIDRGANVNAKDFFGDTPLITAHKKSEIKIIFELIRVKAEVNIQNKKGKTALMYSAYKTSPLRYTMRTKTSKELRESDLLLRCGADVNLKDNIGHTVVMYNYKEKNKCNNGFTLLKRGADLETEDYQGRTTLVQVLQAYGKNFKALELLKLGANPVLKAKYRNILMQPLFISSLVKERNEVIRLLVCNGIVNMMCFTCNFTLSKETYVELCVQSGKYDLLRYVLANCYILNKDLSYIRLHYSSTVKCTTQDRSHFEFTEMDALLQKAASQPWPLVNLAFIAVSTMMGESPEREVRIGNSQLPNPLKDMLMFQTKVAQTAVKDWSTLPVCFEA